MIFDNAKTSTDNLKNIYQEKLLLQEEEHELEVYELNKAFKEK